MVGQVLAKAVRLQAGKSRAIILQSQFGLLTAMARITVQSPTRLHIKIETKALMTYEFSEDTAVQRVADGHYRANISDRWNIMTVPNGGYLLAVVARALREHLQHPDPFSITGHFMKPVAPGPVEIHTETLKVGKAVSFAQAKLVQDNQERLRVTAAFGALEKRSGLDHSSLTMPDIPAFEECVHAKIPLEFFKHVKAAFAPESAQWLHGKYDENCELLGWNSFRDGLEPDALSLLLFADGFPPPVFRKVGPAGWVPTVEMTIQVRAHPAPGPLRCRFASRAITQGYAEEDGEIWDSQGNLVALSRQLEAIRLPKKT